MKKTILAIVAIIILIIIAGMYKFNMTDDDIFVELENGEVVQIDNVPEGATLSKRVLATIAKTDFEATYLAMKEGGARIIDVRTQAEYDAGHYDGATMIDFYATDFKEQLDMLDKEVPYFIHCRSGARSGGALEIMRELGFTTVYDLAGGFANAQDILTIIK